jgi:Deacetylase PdaC
MRPGLLALLTLTGLMCLASCSGGSDAPAAPASSAPSPAASASHAAPVAAAPAVSARTVEVSDALIEYEYSYPAAAGAIPSLKSFLDSEIDKHKRELIETARQEKAAREQADFSYNPLGYWQAWRVVTDLPGWLSLSADVSTYTGGAHPNHGFDTIVWDRQADRRRDPVDLFTSKQALSDVIGKDFCRELDRERAKRRGGEKLGGDFDECIDPADSTLILGSSNGKAFDRIGVLVAPYEAGPYVEGSYEVTLPVTAAVMAAVKPEFRGTFAVKR